MTSAPNLIYVFADQLRYQSVGFAGDEKAHTPHIDQLATESMNCVNTTSSYPVCAPYRASLFTGKYASSTGMVINELKMNPNHHTIAKVLNEAAYETYYIGKWHLWANQYSNHDDVKNSYIPPGPHRLGFDNFWAAYNFHHVYYDTYYHTDSPERLPIHGYEPDFQTSMAIDKLREAAQKNAPFSMFLSYGTPHDPWDADNVPKEFLDLFAGVDFPLPPNYLPQNDPHADAYASLNEQQRAELSDWMRVYYAMTANLDWNVGRLLQAVDELGLRDNTIFVFTSDHGELFGAHGRRAKNIFYDEAVRVPFLVRYPQHIPAGQSTDVCLNTPDLAPTLLGLLKLPIPAEMEGQDLSACLRGEPCAEPAAALLQGMGNTAEWYDGYEWRGLRSKQYTYAIYRVDGMELLFDNQNDPYQMTNLVGNPAYTEVLEDFRASLQTRLAALNDTFEQCTWYRDHWIEDRVILRSATLNA